MMMTMLMMALMVMAMMVVALMVMMMMMMMMMIRWHVGDVKKKYGRHDISERLFRFFALSNRSAVEIFAD